MPKAVIDDITTRYEVVGSGPPLLMFSPGGFDARLEKWTELGVYRRIKLLDHLPKQYQCIIFDRRESGLSGGRVERVTWSDFVNQGKGLLDHLDIDQAHLMGGCMGCSPVIAFAAAHPERILSMVLYWPVGGAGYRLSSHLRFARHLAYVEENGLEGVVSLVKSHEKSFSKDPRGGPWCEVIRNDPAFGEAFAAQDVERYKLIVVGTARTLIDRDTAPGAEPEDLLQLNVPTLIIPGADGFHATSAARYLEECIPNAEYWDIPADEQTERNAPPLILDFLSRTSLS